MQPDKPNDPISRIKQKRQDDAARATEDARTSSIVDAVNQSGTETRSELSKSMQDILMASLIGKDPRLAEVAGNLAELLESIQNASENFKNNGLESIPEVFEAIRDAIVELPAKVAETDKSEELIPYLQGIAKTIQNKELKSVVNVPEVDFEPVVKAIKAIPRPEGDPLKQFKAQDIYEDGFHMQYIGFLNPRGNWYIIENDMESNSLRYVFGEKGYEEAMADPVNKNYQYYDKALKNAKV